MSQDYNHLRLERDSRGVATVTFDVAESPVNVFNSAVMHDLQDVLMLLEAESPRVVVFRSGKASGFFAGADVRQIRSLSTEDEVRAVLLAGQEIFSRIEQLPCPTIAVIHGVCLGGGLEFALACKHRIARDDASTKLGLPEVMLGLIPGWGGTMRLPRQVGLRQALRMILEGSSLSAAKAARAGLVDRALTPATFESEVEQFIADRLAGRTVRSPSRSLTGMFLDATWPGRAIVLATARKKLAKRGEHYPALPAALRAIEAGTLGNLATERDEFAKLIFSPTARNLIDLFFLREKARKLSTWVGAETEPHKVKQAAVIGAGVMGAGIAQLLAINKVPVILKDLTAEIVAGGMEKIKTLTTEAAKKGAFTAAEADAALARVTPAHEWEPLKNVDLVIEAVVEREEVKRTVFRELAERLSSDAVFASNTSALSVSRLAEGVPHSDRVAGLHFFNPVHRMQLVEVVRGRETDDAAIGTLVELVRKLGKVPVVVADSPGFLVNRILFPYMDEAVRLVCEGVPGEDVDREAVRFGMPMGPLELLDQVGLDVAADVAGSLGALSGEDSPTPGKLASMARGGWVGKKAGKGFYEYRNDHKGKPTHWAIPEKGSKSVAPSDRSGLSNIQKRLVYPMINEAAKCLEANVVSQAWAIDLAMVLGTGFAPFRGGPLRTADALGLANVVRDMTDLNKTAGIRFEPCPLLRDRAAQGRCFHEERQTQHEHEEVHA